MSNGYDIRCWTKSPTRASPEEIFSKRRNLPKLPPPKVGEIWVVLKPGIEIGSRLIRITKAFDIQTGVVTFEKLWELKKGLPGKGSIKEGTGLLKMFNTRVNGYAPKEWIEHALGITIEVP